MRLLLNRIALRDNYTVGKLFVDGKYICDTLEDRVRNLAEEKKVAGQTAIPAGTYDIMVARSPKFRRMLPRLLAVPHFEGILIHRGNTHHDTAGCILVGENRAVGRLQNSSKWELKITEMLLKAQSANEKIIITIQ